MKNSRRDIEKIVKSLANERRLEIVAYLAKNRRASVGDIAEHLHLSFKATSKHIRILFLAGVLEREQHGLVRDHHLAENLPVFVRSLIGML